jgi:hypothetical protein
MRPGRVHLVWLTGPLWHPDYNPLTDTVSGLETGSPGWPQTVAFVVFGCLSLVLAGILYRDLERRPLTVAGAVLLGVFGLGIVGAGLFNIGTAPAAHQIASAVAFLSVIAAMFVFGAALRRDNAPRSMVSYTLASALASLVLLALVLGASSVGSDALAAWNGLIQRAFILTWSAWLEVMALRALHSQLGETANTVE